MSYRASNTGPSPYYQQLIKDIKEGNTPGQRRTAFMDNAAMTAVRAGITGLGAVMSASHSNDLQKEQANAEIMRKAIGDQTKASHAPLPPSTIPKEDFTKDEYGLPGQSLGKATELPSYMKNMDTSVMAGQAQADQKLNRSADNVPMGGYTTKNGRESHQDNSDQMSRDIATSNQTMESGGMMNSLQRRPSKY